MTAEPMGQLAEALDITGQLVTGVRDGQWADPTPCPDWNVRNLVSHIITGNRLFAAILRGQPGLPASGLGPGPATAGADMPGAYRDAAGELLAAFGQPGVLEQVFTVPIGTVPGLAALHLRLTELLVHGWDLAQATGQPAPFPDRLAKQELAFTRHALADLPAGRSPFGPPQPVATDAPAIDRLAACLGRAVTTGSG